MSFLDKLKRDWKAKKPLVDTKELDEYVKKRLELAVKRGDSDTALVICTISILKDMGHELGQELLQESLDRLGVSRRRMNYNYGCIAYGWAS